MIFASCMAERVAKQDYSSMLVNSDYLPQRGFVGAWTDDSFRVTVTACFQAFLQIVL